MYKDIMDSIGFIGSYDKEVSDAMATELKRQRQNIELIASENIVSPAVMAAMGSVLTNKYAEGYPGKRYYGGCYAVDVVEDIARQRACELFQADHANVQPHSGAQANMAVFMAVLKQGDRVLIIDDLLATGGTTVTAAKLIESLGGVVAGFAFLVELTDLKGRDLIKDYKVLSLIKY